MMKTSRKQLSAICLNIIAWSLTALVVLLPFMSFFIITIGSYGLSQGLIVALAAIGLLYAYSSRSLGLKMDKTNTIFVIIAVLSLVTTLFVRPDGSAVLFGLKNNILPLAVFFIAQLPFSKNLPIRKRLVWLVAVPGFIISFLAILQSTVISADLLEKIGYNANTINPRQIVDGSLSFYRAFSTLGGPNQLGAYLLLPLAFAIVYGIKNKNKWFLVGVPLLLAGLALSFSRSAWLGALATLFFSILLVLTKKQRIYFVLLSFVAMIMLTGSVYLLAKSNQRFQNVVLHGSYVENQIIGSDQQRITALSNAVGAVVEEPFGHGLGSAGPASFQSSKPVITENWYLQIAYEVGIFGLLLYLFAFGSLLLDFYKNRNSALASSLFAATIGILVANLFLHTWADGTLSLLGFSLYGLYKGGKA